jgi:poly(A) polymerase
VPPARLFDEFLKLFQTGHALESYRELRRFQLFKHLFPSTSVWLDRVGDAGQLFIERALENTDRRYAEDKPITPMFLLGVFLWGPVQDRARELLDENVPENQLLSVASAELMREQVLRISVPRRYSIPMREMLQLQSRFVAPSGPRALAFLESKRFRAAYDLMMLRAEAGDFDAETANWWTEIQQLSPEQRREKVGGEIRDGGKKRRRGGRRAGRPRQDAARDEQFLP